MIIDGHEFWSLHATHGLPLDFLVEELCGQGVYPKWDQVFEAAHKDGSNLKKLMNSLKQYFVGLSGERHLSIGIEAL